jgi:hypothetical protein
LDATYNASGLIKTKRQFPFPVDFASTINKAQEQTLKSCYLHQPVFGHGQLYVSLSRSGDPTLTKIYIRQTEKQKKIDGLNSGSFTNNVAYGAFSL